MTNHKNNKIAGTLTYWKWLGVCFILSSAIIVTSCKKFVVIPPPTTQTVTATVFNNPATATGALTNIYQLMYNNQESFLMAQSTGFTGDELNNYSTGNQQAIEEYTNSMSVTSGLTFGPWSNAYNYIYQANAIIEGLQKYSTFSTAIKNQLTGEAKFIRAYWHFFLTNCYGDIPIVTTTNYQTNNILARSSRSKVYEQIIADLKDAQDLLNNNFVDGTDTAVTTDRVRPTKWAATALLARVYLYNKDYVNAESQSTAVINNSALFSLVSDLNSVFLANSNEAIWQLGIPIPNNFNTYDGLNFILQGAPSDESYQIQSISSQLMNAFEPGDLRKTNWIGSFTTSDVPSVTYYYPYKYKVYANTNITEYNMMLRLAEQYLIRAEARVQLGENAALGDLNIIRNRAGLANYAGATDKSSLLAAILHERQVELFTEWGHRWFDLIRTGNVNQVMGSPGNVCQTKGGTWNSNWELFPLPQSDIIADHNLVQNPGY